MDGSANLQDLDLPLRELLAELERRGYHFITPTPATHERNLARRSQAAPGDLRDVFGWSRPFQRSNVPDTLVEALERSGMLLRQGDRLKSAVRVSRVKGRLFLHSAFPTDAEDAVFLGPDSYRFADFIERELPKAARRIVDVGGGGGVGAIVASGLAPGADLTITDINPTALRLARINAAHAGVSLAALQTSGLENVPTGMDVVLANPPYMAAGGQAYREGGDLHGGELSVEWADAALGKLAPGGRLLLYTGSAILAGGRDQLRAALERTAAARGSTLDYREIDPDVFGEDLETEPYRDVERIAVVTAVMTRGA
ncbi:methyltransferase [Phenylobacterium sp.]|jgi:methylase of polypeptide subunit release factors|uniref:methyltransferase n=1 Tax=Phenylobacterium sp. TaxID=1871053 RepID=UPI002E362716|nr:methyltransferase [Phenylobacterium sp.]HEX2558573.1 methyltransferase [Phenylobacterium sp.]